MVVQELNSLGGGLRSPSALVNHVFNHFGMMLFLIHWHFPQGMFYPFWMTVSCLYYFCLLFSSTSFITF